MFGTSVVWDSVSLRYSGAQNCFGTAQGVLNADEATDVRNRLPVAAWERLEPLKERKSIRTNLQ